MLGSAIRHKHGAEAVARFVAANRAAVEEIRAVVDRYAIVCDLEPASAVNYAITADGLRRLARERTVLQAAGLPVQLSDQVDRPGLPFTVRGVLRLADQAHLHPVRFCEGLAAVFGPTASTRTRLCPRSRRTAPAAPR